MKDLLIQAAKRTGLVDAEQLAEFLESSEEQNARLDEILLRCPYFTEETVLKLFAEAGRRKWLLLAAAPLSPQELSREEELDALRLQINRLQGQLTVHNLRASICQDRGTTRRNAAAGF